MSSTRRVLALWTVVWRLIIGAMLTACAPPANDDARPPSAAATTSAIADSIPLDSCERLAPNAATQTRVGQSDKKRASPSPGSWKDTKRVVLDDFSLDVPVVAVAEPRNASGAYWISHFPGCRVPCAIEVRLDENLESLSADAYVAQLRAVDATVQNNRYLIPGPPSGLRMGSAQGLIMDVPCRDCTSGQIIVPLGSRIATIWYSVDDRDEHQPDLMCRLARVASTFRPSAPYGKH